MSFYVHNITPFILHVYPKDDLIPHDFTPSCFCHPSIKQNAGGITIYRHYPLDNRPITMEERRQLGENFSKP